MALKILLADDSMTAQNMGKKILADAGYDVTTVSNGAAAVKKIAEVHPDIILLDVYMPGYNGLEVCTKTKAAAETSSVPVLLTVGKMEPFRPEDGIKAKADGVIVKPFEATDLITVVKKLAERLQAAREPEPLITERPHHEFSDPSYHDWKTTTAEFHVSKQMVEAADARFEQEHAAATPAAAASSAAAAPAPAKLQTPPAPEPASGDEFAVRPEQHVATPALSIDDSVNLSAPAFSVEPTPAGASVAAFSFAPAAEPAQSTPEPVAPAPSEPAMPVPETVSATPTAELQTFDLRVDAGHVEPPPEIEFTAAAPAEVAPAADPSFEPTSLQEDIEVSTGTDSSLITDAQEISSAFPTRFGVEHPDEVPVGVASDVPELASPASEQAAEAAPATAEITIAADEAPALHGVEPTPEFHSISAALEAAVSPAPPVAPAAQPEPEPERGLSLAEELARALTQTAAAPPVPAPQVAETADITAIVEQMGASPAAVEEPPTPPLAVEPEITAPVTVEAVVTSPAAAEPEPAPSLDIVDAAAVDVIAAPGSPAVASDMETAVAAAVDTVLERIKPALIAQIVRELKG